jgi:hypothetical protein
MATKLERGVAQAEVERVEHVLCHGGVTGP